VSGDEVLEFFLCRIPVISWTTEITAVPFRHTPGPDNNVQILFRWIFGMNKKIIILSLVLISAFLLTAGCTFLSPPPEPTPVPTPVPTTTPPTPTPTTATPTPTPTASTEPGPTDTLPSYWPLSISVEKAGTYSMTIMTSFDGGKGAGSVLRLTSTVTRPDGTVTTKSIEKPKVGDVIEIEGTKGNDRLEVTVMMNSGSLYKIIDQNMPYKSRN
jgi:hypothetical protein